MKWPKRRPRTGPQPAADTPGNDAPPQPPKTIPNGGESPAAATPTTEPPIRGVQAQGEDSNATGRPAPDAAPLVGTPAAGARVTDTGTATASAGGIANTGHLTVIQQQPGAAASGGREGSAWPGGPRRWQRTVLSRVTLWSAAALGAFVGTLIAVACNATDTPSTGGSASTASASTTPSPKAENAPSSSRAGKAVKVAALHRELSDAQSWVHARKLEMTDAELNSLNAAYEKSYIPGVDRWLRAKGTVDTPFYQFKLVLEGNRDTTVRIIGMRAVKHCTAPLNGTLFTHETAGADASVALGFDLDQPTSIAHEIYDGWHWRRDYFARKTISLKPGEQQTFQIKAQTVKHYCRFTLELTIVDNGRTITQTIDNQGKPFETTAMATRYKEFYHAPIMITGGHKFYRETPPTFSGKPDPPPYDN